MIHRSLPRMCGAGAVMLGMVLAQPAVAQPPSCDAPPGVAGVDQYCESTPGGSGERREDRGGGGSGRAGDGGGGPGSAAPGSTEDRVRPQPGGPAVIDSLPPGDVARADGRDGSGGGNGAGSAPGRSGAQGSPASAPAEPGGTLSGAASAAESVWTGEMRVVLAVLVLTLVAALAMGARRRTPTA